ncbi:hypothetical protein QYM36_010924, partial [Artemia franciscana]
YDNPASAKYITLITAINLAVRSFGYEQFSISIVKLNSRVQLELRILSDISLSAADNLQLALTVLGGQKVLVIPGLQLLQFDLNTLNFELVSPPCDTSKCQSGGDEFASCSDSVLKCACSKGFVAKEGVCLDIDECEDSNACGTESASCINQPGYFECICPLGFLPYIGGCIDIKATAIEPCAKEENAAQCVLLGATCSKDLSFGFFSCRCQFPMVPSPKGCVSILEQELLATKDYQLEISGVEWSDSLSTITSIESLLLIEKITTWFNTILKDQLISSVTDLDVSVCQVISFIRSNSVGVEAKVSLTLSDFSVLDSILELIVPGIDISIKTASLISEKVVQIDASLCTDDACLPGQSCTVIASEVGFQCTCPFPQTLIEGSCKLDPSLSRFVEQKVSIQLNNQWISDYDNTASAKYITLITAINLAVRSFGYEQFSISIVKLNSRVQLELRILSDISLSAADNLQLALTVLGGQKVLVIPGLQLLQFDLNTLNFELVSPPCDTSKCQSGGDEFASCSDSVLKCACSKGFVAKEGVCLDIDECEDSNACGTESASCINQPGYFECICPLGFLPYIGGCIDIKATAIEPCAKEENAAQCVLLGATCSKDLSFGFFSCRCQFPMVPSPKGCVSILEQELLATKDYQLEISGVEWSDSLSTITSIESLLLIEKITTWFNTILKDQLISSVTDLDVSVCQVISFIRSNSVGVEAKVSLTLSDFSLLDSILELIVPGIDISIKTASLISEKVVQIDASLCTDDACLPGQSCTVIASEVGFQCTCPFPQTLIEGSCKLDPSQSRFVEQKISIQLTNQWISDYDDPTTTRYITLITAIDLALRGYGIELFSISITNLNSRVQLEVRILSDVAISPEANLETASMVLGGQDFVSLPGIQLLQLDLNTLQFELVTPPCDTPKCQSGGDEFAVCSDSVLKCACSNGFLALDGTCVDTDECTDSDACRISGATCINKVGYFECSCPAGFVSSLQGCISTEVSLLAPCTVEKNTTCASFEASCFKDLSSDFSGCQCKFPMIISSNGCIQISGESSMTASLYRIELGGIEWEDTLLSLDSLESLILLDKMKILINTVLKKQMTITVEALDPSVFQTLSIMKTSSGAVGLELIFILEDQLMVETVKDKVVPGVEITITSLTKVLDIGLSDPCTPDIISKCISSNAKCKPSLSYPFYKCICGFPTVQTIAEDGKTTCSIDPKMDTYGGQLIILPKSVNISSLELSYSIDTILLRDEVEIFLSALFPDPDITYFDGFSNEVTVLFYINAKSDGSIAADLSSRISAALSAADALALPSSFTPKIETLEVTKNNLTCDRINLCVSGDDKYAICSDGTEGTGQICTCSIGFKEQYNICQDKDDCVSNPCNDAGDTTATCTDKVGYFECSCSDDYIFSTNVGCVRDPRSDNPCDSSPCDEATSECVLTLNIQGYECKCNYPFVKRSNGKCSRIIEGKEKVFNITIPLSGNIKWSAELADRNSLSFLKLKQDANKFIKVVFKDAVGQIQGFSKSETGKFRNRFSPFKRRQRSYETEVLVELQTVEQTECDDCHDALRCGGNESSENCTKSSNL